MNYSIHLGSRASIWSHRGYTVRGSRVLCESREDALAILFHSFPDPDQLHEFVCDDTTYYYDNEGACDADRDGSRALAVIAPTETT